MCVLTHCVLQRVMLFPVRHGRDVTNTTYIPVPVLLWNRAAAHCISLSDYLNVRTGGKRQFSDSFNPYRKALCSTGLLLTAFGSCKTLKPQISGLFLSSVYFKPWCCAIKVLIWRHSSPSRSRSGVNEVVISQSAAPILGARTNQRAVRAAGPRQPRFPSRSLGTSTITCLALLTDPDGWETIKNPLPPEADLSGTDMARIGPGSPHSRGNVKLDSFLRRNTDQAVYERIRSYEPCVVVSETINKAYMHVVLSDELVFLTEYAPRTLTAALSFRRVRDIKLVRSITVKWIRCEIQMIAFELIRFVFLIAHLWSQVSASWLFSNKVNPIQL